MFDNIHDVESDLSVFHRVSEMGDLDAQLFLSRAVRLPAYTGATRARLDLQRQAQGQFGPGSRQSPAPVAAPAAYEDPNNTPAHIVAQLRAGVIAAAHGGKPVDEWLGHEAIMEEAVKYGG